MSIFIAIVSTTLLFAIVFAIWKKSASSLKKYYWPSFILHLLSGVSMGLLYTYYYNGGDTIIYFKDACVLSELAKEDFSGYLNFIWNSKPIGDIETQLSTMQPRVLFVVKLVSLTNHLSASNYWLSTLYFSTIAFMATWYFSSVLGKWLPNTESAIAFSFLLFPSIVFWSSGITKETIALAGLFCISAVFVKQIANHKISWLEWALFVISIWLVYSVKYYYLAIFLPILVTTWLHQKIIQLRLNSQSLLLSVATWILLLLLLLIPVTQIHPNFHPTTFLSVLHKNYVDFIALSSYEDALHFSNLEATWQSVVRYSPLALFSGLFRPFPWQASNALQFFASLENVLLFVFTITALPSLLKLKQNPQRVLVIATLTFCVVLCIFLTLSTPNYGTLVRYRVGFLPFFVFLITASNPLFYRLVNFLRSRIR